MTLCSISCESSARRSQEAQSKNVTIVAELLNCRTTSEIFLRPIRMPCLHNAVRYDSASDRLRRELRQGRHPPLVAAKGPVFVQISSCSRAWTLLCVFASLRFGLSLWDFAVGFRLPRPAPPQGFVHDRHVVEAPPPGLKTHKLPEASAAVARITEDPAASRAKSRSF